MALAGVWPALMGPGGEGSGLPGGPEGYMEFWADPEAEGEDPGASAAPVPGGDDLRTRMKRVVMAAVGAAAVVAAGGGAWVVLRGRKARAS